MSVVYAMHGIQSASSNLPRININLLIPPKVYICRYICTYIYTIMYINLYLDILQVVPCKVAA